MKKLFTTMMLLFACGSIFAQQLPNSSFENWTNNGLTNEPDEWLAGSFFTDNYPSYGTLKGTDFYDGSYSLHLKTGRINLTNYGIIDTTAFVFLGKMDSTISGPPRGLPFTDRPTKFTFYYKYKPLTALPIEQRDTAYVYIGFRKDGNTIGRGTFKVAGEAVSGSWAYHEIVIDWYSTETPDSVVAEFTSSMSRISYDVGECSDCPLHIGSEFLVDKLELKYNPIGLTEYANQLAFDVFPNPANEALNINIGKANNGTFNIYNVLGELVKTGILNQMQEQINIADIPAGSYFMEVEANNLSGRKKIFITK